MDYFPKRLLSVFISILFLILLGGSWVHAAELTETEKTLLEYIKSLEKRIEYLESQVVPKKEAEAEAETETEPSEGEVAREEQTLEGRVKILETYTAEAHKKSPTDLRAYWDEGLRFSSYDEQFKLKIGGRISHDWAFFKQSSELKNALGEEEDGIEFRRAYLYMSGLIYGWIEYKAEFDFASGNSEDVYVGFTKIPYLGKIRVGRFDEPFGLELRTSNRYTTFMERGLTNALVPGTQGGIMAKNLVYNDRIFWAAGFFRNTDSNGRGKGDGAYNYTGRLVGLPLYADEGKKLIHLGLGLSHRNANDSVRLKTRPEAHLSNFDYVDTNDILANDENLLGLEFAWVNGPFSIQSEYIWDRVDTKAGGNVDFSAFYIFASYFLTGESRYYDRGSATFDRPRPFKNFRGKEGGFGAWEIAARYSHIDLNDGAIRGGKEDNVTLGLNWYLNPNTKLMLNYIRGDIDRDDSDGNLNILQMRAQIDF